MLLAQNTLSINFAQNGVFDHCTPAILWRGASQLHYTCNSTPCLIAVEPSQLDRPTAAVSALNFLRRKHLHISAEAPPIEFSSHLGPVARRRSASRSRALAPSYLPLLLPHVPEAPAPPEKNGAGATRSGRWTMVRRWCDSGRKWHRTLVGLCSNMVQVKWALEYRQMTNIIKWTNNADFFVIDDVEYVNLRGDNDDYYYLDWWNIHFLMPPF